jgi:hypothetical protein
MFFPDLRKRSTKSTKLNEQDLLGSCISWIVLPGQGEDLKNKTPLFSAYHLQATHPANDSRAMDNVLVLSNDNPDHRQMRVASSLSIGAIREPFHAIITAVSRVSRTRRL